MSKDLWLSRFLLVLVISCIVILFVGSYLGMGAPWWLKGLATVLVLSVCLASIEYAVKRAPPSDMLWFVLIGLIGIAGIIGIVIAVAVNHQLHH